MSLLALTLIISASVAAPGPSSAPATLRYPETQRGTTVDDYHGTKVADPYRWLEDDRSAQTADWVKAQNKVTQAYLDQIPQRDAIRSRMTEIWNYERFGLPEAKGPNVFFTKNNGLQPQSVLYVAKSPTDPGRVLLDPNTMSEKGTVALSGRSISHDGKLMAYGIAESGSDWQVWRVRDVETGKDLPDEIRWVKFSSMSWTGDNEGFVYSRFAEPSEGSMLTALNDSAMVYYHKVGTSQKDDVLLYHRPDQPRWSLGAGVSDDGRYLFLYASEGSSPRNRLYVRDLTTHPLDWKPTELDQKIAAHDALLAKHRAEVKAQGDKADAKVSEAFIADHAQKRAELVKQNGGMAYGFLELVDDFGTRFDVIDTEGTTLFVWSDENAPRGKVVAVDMANPAKANWKTIIPEAPEAMTSASRVGPRLVIEYLKDAASVVRVFDLLGAFDYEVDLPGVGSVAGFATDRSSPVAFYSYTSFTHPATIHAIDVVTREQRLIREPKVAFNRDDFVTEKVFYESFDGTRIPLFITRRKDAKLDGSERCILYGYGGFNVSLTPGFSPVNVAWVERGGIYAVACIRGGGEYGAAWHQAAIKEKRPVAFKDFMAAGEFLVKGGYTSPKRLAIRGGSNGGLLVGAVMTQRPDLIGAAIPEVGVMDMLRFHTFTIGWAWKTDYGTSEDPAMFQVLNAYSPYHALLRAKPGTLYPPTLVTTADHDDRVVPGHSFKFAAALQATGSPTGTVDPARPLLIRIEESAGHGAGKPTQKSIDQNTDILAFLEWVMR